MCGEGWSIGGVWEQKYVFRGGGGGVYSGSLGVEVCMWGGRTIGGGGLGGEVCMCVGEGV